MGKKLLFFLCFCISVGTATAQTTTVRGLVEDENGEVLVGVSVIETGTTNAFITGIDGKFEMTIGSASTLDVAYAGYLTQTVTVSPQNRNNLVVRLQPDNQLLDEVMVVAFGKMKKEAFTGSAGIVSSSDLEKSHAANPAQALVGRVAGLQMSNSSFQPGSSPSITIRGFGSISSDTEPLIVLDGMPFDGDLNILNPDDIESMTVLKDAASNALYGARGANGVIMITTKRGRTSEVTINVDANWGFNSNGQSRYKTTDSRQFYETYYKMLYNQYSAADGGNMSAADAHTEANRHLTTPSTGVGPGYMIYTVPTGQDFILAGGTMNPGATMGALYTSNDTKLWLQADDWGDIGLLNGFRHEYNVSASGSTERVNYYTSIGFLDMDGIQENSGQQRITARAKLDYQAKKWLRIGANFNYTKYQYSQTGEGTIGAGSLWGVVRTQAPIYPVYYRDENKQIMIDQWGEKMYDFAQNYGLSRAGGVGGNTIFSNKYRDTYNKAGAVTASGYADINITKDLSATINASIYDRNLRYTYITSPFIDHYTSSEDNGYLYKSNSRIFTYNVQQLINYNKQFGRHEVTALLGHEYYNYRYEGASASGYNFGIEGTTELATVLNLNNTAYTESIDYNNEGYLFRGMYNYDQKYYASLSFRRDASSRFSHEDGRRWGNFWSAGGAWIISKENFFNSSWVDMLKMKLSIGSQGNDNIGNYLYSDSYDVNNNGNMAAYQWRQKGKPDITWETNTNWNAGFEFELFRGRLNGSLDYFYRKTTDMLFSLKTPPSIGYTSYFVNLGDMRNTGLELVLNGNIINNKNFRWDINFNMSYVSNKVLRLPDEIKVTSVEGYDGYINNDMNFVSKYQYFVAEGMSLYTWYLKQYAGVDPETGEALYYKDTVDADGNITGRETVKDSTKGTDYLCGDALPPLYGGIGTTLEFYGVDFSFNLNYQIGGKVFDYNYQSLMHSSGRTATTWHTDIFNAWTPENTVTDIPRLRYTESLSQTARSDRFLTDASYLNIQNVTLGYTLPSNLVKRAGIQKIRVYVSADNLYLFSARRGLDPRQFLMGYTNPEISYAVRTVLGGISLTF